MRVLVSVPSKTFLVGEYAALAGGPALVACTSPRFNMEFGAAEESQCAGIHPESPAGRFLRTRSLEMRNLAFEFKDPHEEQGGFGASSAQFISLWLAHGLWSSGMAQMPVDQAQALRDFREVSSSSSSGYDVLAQLTGGLCEIQGASVRARVWPFRDKGFFILRTGNKVKSHEHLRGLALEKPQALLPLAQRVMAALGASQWDEFVDGIVLFRRRLESEGLTHEKSVALLERLDGLSTVAAAKACGAMGADTVVVFFDSENRELLRGELERNFSSFEIVCSHEDLSPGVEVSLRSIFSHPLETKC